MVSSTMPWAVVNSVCTAGRPSVSESYGVKVTLPPLRETDLASAPARA